MKPGSLPPETHNETAWDLLLKTAQVVEQEKTPAKDSAAARTRTVYKTAFKYPYVVVEEECAPAAPAGPARPPRRKGMVADHLLVQLRPGVSKSQLEKVNQKYSAHVAKVMHTTGLFLIELKDHSLSAVDVAVKQYKAEADVVAYAEPDYIVHALDLPNDSRVSEQWALHNVGQTGGTEDADIDAPLAWQVSTGAANLRVGVIDTGIDYTHPDLAPNIFVNPGEIPGNALDDDGNGYVDDVHGWNFVSNTNDVKGG